jgi:sugar lactone lactonase YvrE
MTGASETAPSARSIGTPQSIHVDAKGRLYVVDIANHRVLYWNTIPGENYAAADGVIGQPNMTSGLANNGGLSVHTLQSPNAVLSVDERLYIADTGNNRVLMMPRP